MAQTNPETIEALLIYLVLTVTLVLGLYWKYCPYSNEERLELCKQLYPRNARVVGYRTMHNVPGFLLFIYVVLRYFPKGRLFTWPKDEYMSYPFFFHEREREDYWINIRDVGRETTAFLLWHKDHEPVGDGDEIPVIIV